VPSACATQSFSHLACPVVNQQPLKRRQRLQICEQRFIDVFAGRRWKPLLPVRFCHCAQEYLAGGGDAGPERGGPAFRAAPVFQGCGRILSSIAAFVMLRSSARYSPCAQSLIDAKGLDTGAAWPKWERDPANSGNPIPDLLPLYTCP
jgi:hypothetical protein